MIEEGSYFAISFKVALVAGCQLQMMNRAPVTFRNGDSA